MRLLFMDTTCDPNSSGSESAEDAPSEERDTGTEGYPKHSRGTKRRQRNRDAARKSRKKQTERADELHEELQCLERANSALEKEIKALRKEHESYTLALEQHEPLCCLKNNKANLDSNINCSSPSTTAAPPKMSCSVTTLAPSSSTCSNSSLELHTTIASPPDIFPITLSQAPHSLFSNSPNPTNLTPGCTNLLLPTTTTMNVQTNTGLKVVEKSSYHSNGTVCFTSPITYSTSTNADVSYSDCQPCPPHNFHLFTQVHTDTYPSLTFGPKSHEHPQNPQVDSLLPSLLTAPGPFDRPQSTTSNLDVPTPLQPLVGDPIRDLSLIEFLEDNDWVLTGQ